LVVTPLSIATLGTTFIITTLRRTALSIMTV
jgi:hypothetical protein